MKKNWLKISIILNILFFGILCFGAYYKRDSIKAYAEKFYNMLFLEKNLEETGVNFGEFVQKKYQPEIQFINNDKEKKIKIAVLGNSITLIPDWNGGAGLTASGKDHDYVHVLLNRLSNENDLGIEYIVLNIAEFESGYEYFDFNCLEKIKEFNAEIIILQIGENVIAKTLKDQGELFIKKYVELIRYCGGKDTIVCLPFWPNREKINLITEAALISESYLVDLSHLGSGIEPLNFARAEKKYEHPGVAAHPGDYGMENIAKVLYITIRKIVNLPRGRTAGY